VKSKPEEAQEVAAATTWRAIIIQTRSFDFTENMANLLNNAVTERNNYRKLKVKKSLIDEFL
jgi:hypothetical protein